MWDTSPGEEKAEVSAITRVLDNTKTELLLFSKPSTVGS